jgi:tRNA dimethylallyltransferase
VFEHTGEAISAIQARSAPPYDILVLGLARPRSVLYARIDRRIAAMIEAGLEGEVRALVGRGIGFDVPAMSGVGYGEWRSYLSGDVDRDAVVREIARNTRRLVRQQATWFRADDPRIEWFDLESSGYDDVLRRAAGFLAGAR